MPYVRIDKAAALTGTLTPAELFDRIAGGPTVAIFDCRKILRIGLLPRSCVVRRKGMEDMDKAMERVLEEMMWDDPPDDQSTAILVGARAEGDEEADDASEIAAAAAYLRAHFGTENVLGLAGGANALDEDADYRFLLGMSPQRAAALPSKLSERILFGSTASASDAKSLKALGVTHIVSLVNDPAFTVPPNTPPFRHLRVRAGGVARERGTDGLRSLLDEALPFILAAIESSNGEKVLIHAQAATGPTAAAAIACAALVADGASELSVAAAAARLESVRPASALHDDAIRQLEQCEAWLSAGAPPSEDAVDVNDATSAMDEVEEVKMMKKPMPPPPPPMPTGPVEGEEMSVAHALQSAGDRMQAALMASMPTPDDDDSEDDGDYAG